MAELVVHGRQTSGTSRYDKRLGQILKSAVRLMAKQGYERTSVRQVAKQAKVTLSGLYYYIAGKEDLLFLIQFHTFSSLVEELKNRLAVCESSVDALRAVIRTHLDHFIAHMDELRVCARELETLTGTQHQRVLALRREYFGMALTVVRDLIDKNNARLDPEVATLSVFGALNWMYQWYNPKRGVSVDHLETELTRLFLGAMGCCCAAHVPPDTEGTRS